MTGHRPALEELRALVDQALQEFLEGSERRLEENSFLISEIRRMISAGGKRLRPAFCYWGYRAAGRAHEERTVRAAASLELLHTFALVHDDIMDASDERRGQPTVHARHGVSVAILVGDLALALADACLFGSGFDPSELAGAWDAYLTMREEVIAGQYLDVRAAGEDVDEVEARRIAVLKSGRYSVEKPLVIGACLGGAPQEVVSGLAAFGETLGEAFQFRDDLLGTFGERSATGKPIDSDIREGKRNLLFAYARSALEGERRRRFLSLWGAGTALGPDEVAEVRELLEACGARAHLENLVGELTSKAQESLAVTPLPREVRSALAELADLAAYRRS